MSALPDASVILALQEGMRSSQYWMSLMKHAPDDFTLYLYPVHAHNSDGEPQAFAPEPQDREPLISFAGAWHSVMEQLIAYQVAEVLA